MVSKASLARRGTTLVELTVAAALMMLLLGGCAMALRSAAQYYRRISDQTAMENSLLVVTSMLNKDLGESSRRAIAYVPGAEPSITFPVPRGAQGELLVDHAGGNKLKFGTILSYRVAGAAEELRRYVDLLNRPEALAPKPLDELTPARDATYFASSVQYKTLLNGVKELTLVGVNFDENGIEVVTGDDLYFAKAIKVTVKAQRKTDRTYGVTLSFYIKAQN